MSVFFKIGIFLYSRAESQIFNITLSYFWIEMKQICYNHQYFKRYKKLTQITVKAFCEDIIKRERQSIIEDLQGPFFYFSKM